MDGEPLSGLFPRERADPAPGAVHLPDWLSAAEQRDLVASCRDWARPPAGMRTVTLPTGGVMSVRMVCLGWHWYPYGYARTVVDGDDAPVKPFPPVLGELARRALADAYGSDVSGFGFGSGSYGSDPYRVGSSGNGPSGTGLGAIAGASGYAPDIAVVNHYPHGARMGLHRDREERIDAPVVSLSLGDTCVFRLGNTETRTRPWTDLELRSGDLLVFGGPARFAYHGVVRTLPGTAYPHLGLVGRLNITIRQSGLE